MKVKCVDNKCGSATFKLGETYEVIKECDKFYYFDHSDSGWFKYRFEVVKEDTYHKIKSGQTRFEYVVKNIRVDHVYASCDEAYLIKSPYPHNAKKTTVQHLIHISDIEYIEIIDEDKYLELTTPKKEITVAGIIFQQKLEVVYAFHKDATYIISEEDYNYFKQILVDKTVTTDHLDFLITSVKIGCQAIEREDFLKIMEFLKEVFE